MDRSDGALITKNKERGVVTRADDMQTDGIVAPPSGD